MARLEIYASFIFSEGKVRPFLDMDIYDEIDIEYIVTHHIWENDEWIDPETGLDIPPPHHKDLWRCTYTIKTDQHGISFAILMPEAMINHGPPRYVSPGHLVLIEQMYRQGNGK